jgi:zinc/manganese transport system substrate-binding protein
MQRLSLAFAFALTIGPTAIARADLDVVTTTADLASVVKEVGGDHVEVTALALPTQDPHFVDARPHLALVLARADLLIAVGLDLEVGWLPTLQTGARNGDIQSGARGFLDASTLVDVLEVPARRVDRSMGDVHPGGNPHYMLDPRRVARVARGIARKLGELDPEHRTDYERNATAFVTRLERERARWERELAPLRGQVVIPYHKSMNYLADWLGLELPEHLEPRPGIAPNPAHVARVLGLARDRHARMILQESFYPTSTSRLVADRAGVPLVVITAAPDFRGGQSYFAWMNALVERLKGASRAR